MPIFNIKNRWGNYDYFPNRGHIIKNLEEIFAPYFIHTSNNITVYIAVDGMKIHNEVRSAIIIDDKEYWVLDGHKIDCKTQQEFEKIKNMKAFW